MTSFITSVPVKPSGIKFKRKAFYGIERIGFNRLMILPGIGALVAPADGYYHIVGLNPKFGLVIPLGVPTSKNAGELAEMYASGGANIVTFPTLKALMAWAVEEL